MLHVLSIFEEEPHRAANAHVEGDCARAVVPRAANTPLAAFVADDTRVRARLVAIEAAARRNTDHFRACAGHDTSVPMPADARTPASESISLFHSKRVPPLSLAQLADALKQQGARHVDATALAVGVALMERYCANCADRSPTLHSMHRLLVACVQVGMKAHCDGYYRNDTFASMVCIQAYEINRLETALVTALDWHLLVVAGDVAWAAAADATRAPEECVAGSEAGDGSMLSPASSVAAASTCDSAFLASSGTSRDGCDVSVDMPQ